MLSAKEANVLLNRNKDKYLYNLYVDAMDKINLSVIHHSVELHNSRMIIAISMKISNKVKNHLELLGYVVKLSELDPINHKIAFDISW